MRTSIPYHYACAPPRRTIKTSLSVKSSTTTPLLRGDTHLAAFLTLGQSRFDPRLKPFEHTAAYDSMIAFNYFAAFWFRPCSLWVKRKEAAGRFPAYAVNLELHYSAECATARTATSRPPLFIKQENVKRSVRCHRAITGSGKALLANKYRRYRPRRWSVKRSTSRACAIVKHANPCGRGGKYLLFSTPRSRL